MKEDGVERCASSQRSCGGLYVGVRKMNIDGETQLVGIVGHAVSYTLSPAIHNAAFSCLDMNWAYVPLRVTPGELGEAMRGLRALGFKGFNVTIPHKTGALLFLDGLRGDAEVLGAVNTVVIEDGRSFGYNTDMEGFRAFMRDAGIDAAGSSVLLIGSGGASRAVAMALAAGGAERIYIMNRTQERAYALAETLKRAFPATEITIRTFDMKGSSILGECDIVVNCTPLAGHEDSGLPLDYGGFAAEKWAIDLKYEARTGGFLQRASARGARVADGGGMLIRQAAVSFELWTGSRPPLQEMRDAFRAALGDR